MVKPAKHRGSIQQYLLKSGNQINEVTRIVEEQDAGPFRSDPLLCGQSPVFLLCSILGPDQPADPVGLPDDQPVEKKQGESGGYQINSPSGNGCFQVQQ